MTANIEIQLNGFLFKIEESAYALLKDLLKSRGMSEQASLEVSKEIEIALAAFFSAKKVDVLTTVEVQEAVAHLSGYEKDTKKMVNFNKGKLHRHLEDRWIAGVCGGIAAHLGIPSLFVRAVFFIGLFLGSLSFWLYIILWIGMRKKPHSEYAKDKSTDIPSNPIDAAAKDFLVEIATIIWRVFKKITGGILLIVSLFCVFLLIILYNGSKHSTLIINDIDFSSMQIWSMLLRHTYVSSTVTTMLLICVALWLVAIVYTSLVWLGWIKPPTFHIRFFIRLVTLMSFLSLATSALFIWWPYKEKGIHSLQLLQIPVDNSTALQIGSISNVPQIADIWGSKLVFLPDSSLYINTVEVELIGTDQPNISIYLTGMARGSDTQNATLLARKIPYTFEQKDNQILLSNGFVLNKDQIWHFEHIKLDIYVPKNKPVILLKSAQKLQWQHKEIESWLEYTPYGILVKMNDIHSVTKITDLGMDEIDNP